MQFEAIERLLWGLEASGYTVLDFRGGEPAELVVAPRATRRSPLTLAVYAWPLGTEHARPGFRRLSIGRTDPGPLESSWAARTLLLGYAGDLDTFAAFQPEAHRSPAPRASVRVPDEVMREARELGVSIAVRAAGAAPESGAEIVTAFEPTAASAYLESLPALAELRRELESTGLSAVPEIADRARTVLWTPMRHSEAFERPAETESRIPWRSGREDLLVESSARQKPPARDVNMGFADVGSGVPLDGDTPLLPGSQCLFWLEIGERVAQSIVGEDVELPIDLLPERAELDVVLFGFADGIELEHDRDVGTLLLSEEGAVIVSEPVARPDVGAELLKRRLFLPVRAPAVETTAAMRCNIYCRGTLVQSWLVSAAVAEAPQAKRALAAELEYTLSHSLSPEQLATVPGADLSLMVNGDDETHHVRFYAPGEEQPRFKGDTEIAPAQLNTLIKYTREALRMTAWNTTEEWTEDDAPNYQGAVDDAELRDDLAELAKRGAFTYKKIVDKLFKSIKQRKKLEGLLRRHGRIEIAAEPDQFVPAALLYDAPIKTSAPIDKLRLCGSYLEARSSSEPLERTPCFADSCPNWDDEMIVCPSGFWGYRHALGWPVTSEDMDATGVLARAGEPRVAAAFSDDLAEVPEHRDALLELLDDADLAPDQNALFDLMRAGKDQVVYLYCHGGVTDGGVPYVRVGQKESDDWISLDELFDLSLTGPRSLVFLNGCRTSAVSPSQAFDLVTAFIDHASALGVIGTEITVFEPMASRFAIAFLRAFLRDGLTAGEAVRVARLNVLKQSNPLGLAYVPFVMAGTQFNPPLAEPRPAA